MIRDHYYEIHEGNQDGVKVIAHCGSEQDARLMISLAREGCTRSWIKCQFLPPDTVETSATHVEEPILPQKLDLPEGNAEPFVV